MLENSFVVGGVKMNQELLVSWQCLACEYEQKSRIKYDRKSAQGYFHQIETPFFLKENEIFLECEKCGKKYLYPQDKLMGFGQGQSIGIPINGNEAKIRHGIVITPPVTLTNK